MIKHEEALTNISDILADFQLQLSVEQHNKLVDVLSYINEQEKKGELIKRLIDLVNRYLGAVSYDVDQTNYGLDIVNDIKETIKALEEEMK